MPAYRAAMQTYVAAINTRGVCGLPLCCAALLVVLREWKALAHVDDVPQISLEL